MSVGSDKVAVGNLHGMREILAGVTLERLAKG